MPHPPLPLQLENTQPSASATTPFRPKTAKTVLAEELKDLLLTEIERVVADARTEFRHHHELFVEQAKLTETLFKQELRPQAALTDNSLQHLVHHDNNGSAANVGHPMEDPTVRYDYLSSYVPSHAYVPSHDHHMQYGGADDDRDSNLLTPTVQAVKPKEPEKKVRASQKLMQATSGDAGVHLQQEVEQHMRQKVFANHYYAEEELCVPEYKVENLYYERGVAQSIARSEIFQNITLSVIILNAIYIGVDADLNRSDSISESHIVFQVCEAWFFCFFAIEWFIRFAAFKSKLDCIRDMWFKFDTALVFMMVIENTLLPIMLGGAGIPIPTSMIKLVRLMRLARMARLLRSLPELMAMIKGVRMSLRAVGSALLLLLILVYIFSIIVFVLLRDSIDTLVDSNGAFFAKTNFGTLSLTMWTLLVDGAFMDSYGALSRKLIDSDLWITFFVLIIFVLASALTVMNMLIGVLCEVVTGVAAAEKEQADIHLVKETLLLMLMDLDVTGDGKISRAEMAGVIENDVALAVLKSMEVNAPYLMEHVQMYFEDTVDGNLAIADILDLILMLRGDRTPTVKDMLHGQHYQSWKVMQFLRQQEQQMSSWFKSLGLKGHLREPR